MCFSASASFTAAIGLCLIGAAIWKRGVPRPFQSIALIPFLFAVQQAAEGVIWSSDRTSLWAQNIFLFVAFCVWPIFIPFAFLKAEGDPKRGRYNYVALGLGIATAFFLLTMIPQIEISACSHAIHYELNSYLELRSQHAIGIIYIASVLIPLFVSKQKGFVLIGALLFFSGWVFFYVEEVWFISLWCFLAAIISGALIFVIPKKGGS
ncbi:MAG: hypothetical protein FJZ60_01935 [Chlamydiae bacterium]|nr:hypothetical protein [Chlamydiota bacterium]